MKTIKRSSQKRMTTQSRIIRYMRISRRISLRAAASHLGISCSAICHYELGRMDIAPGRIRDLVCLYQYTIAEFEEYLAGKPIPVLSIKDECTLLLDRIDETKLRAVHGVLLSFASSIGDGTK